mmetsp:Transcript_97335/g.236712  ORF Transcript_97335/g.236712 Transcript_97335/m.236712 type:complete len:329 (-) Transcript_97335:18-1004(-)
MDQQHRWCRRPPAAGAAVDVEHEGDAGAGGVLGLPVLHVPAHLQLLEPSLAVAAPARRGGRPLDVGLAHGLEVEAHVRARARQQGRGEGRQQRRGQGQAAAASPGAGARRAQAAAAAVVGADREFSPRLHPQHCKNRELEEERKPAQDHVGSQPRLHRGPGLLDIAKLIYHHLRHGPEQSMAYCHAHEALQDPPRAVHCLALLRPGAGEAQDQRQAAGQERQVGADEGRAEGQQGRQRDDRGAGSNGGRTTRGQAKERGRHGSVCSDRHERPPAEPSSKLHRHKSGVAHPVNYAHKDRPSQRKDCVDQQTAKGGDPHPFRHVRVGVRT